MKNLKKGLGVVLALILVLNVFAISAFAAVPAENAFALTLAPTETSYSAGDVVTFEVSLETIALCTGTAGGEFDIAYNTSVFEPITDLSAGATLAVGGVTVAGYEWAKLTGCIDATNSSCTLGSVYGTTIENNTYGWDESFHICIVQDAAGAYLDCTTAQKILSFQLKLKDDVADGDYVVGITNNGFEVDGANYIVDENNVGTYGGMGDTYGVELDKAFYCGRATVTVGAAGPAVTTTDPLVQWQNKETGKMKLAFTGAIAGLTPEFSEGNELSNITACGVIFSNDANATLEREAANTVDVPCYTIYGAAAGTDFTFRAIMNDVDYDGAATMYFRAYIVYNGTVIYGAAESTTAATEYNEAVAALPSFAK